jgi:hypothetical protein
MSTLTKLALGLMGRLRPAPPLGDAAATLALPAPDRSGGLPLMAALAARRSARAFAPQPLSPQQLSDLLWAAFGSQPRRRWPHRAFGLECAGDRPLRGPARGVPTVMTPPRTRCTSWWRRICGASPATRTSSTTRRWTWCSWPTTRAWAWCRWRSARAMPRWRRARSRRTSTCTCASVGLAAVIRAWIDRQAIADALGLPHDHQVLLSQTVGYPPKPRR